MLLRSFTHPDRARYGVKIGEQVADIGEAADYPALANLLARADFTAVAHRATEGSRHLSIGELEFQPVVPKKPFHLIEVEPR